MRTPTGLRDSRTRHAVGYPEVNDADFAELMALAARLEILPPPPTGQPAVAPAEDLPAVAAAPATQPAVDAAAGAAPVEQVKDASAPG
jgi:hypothetical protein